MNYSGTGHTSILFYRPIARPVKNPQLVGAVMELSMVLTKSLL